MFTNKLVRYIVTFVLFCSLIVMSIIGIRRWLLTEPASTTTSLYQKITTDTNFSQTLAHLRQKDIPLIFYRIQTLCRQTQNECQRLSSEILSLLIHYTNKEKELKSKLALLEDELSQLKKLPIFSDDLACKQQRSSCIKNEIIQNYQVIEHIQALYRITNDLQSQSSSQGILSFGVFVQKLNEFKESYSRLPDKDKFTSQGVNWSTLFALQDDLQTLIQQLTVDLQKMSLLVILQILKQYLAEIKLLPNSSHVRSVVTSNFESCFQRVGELLSQLNQNALLNDNELQKIFKLLERVFKVVKCKLFPSVPKKSDEPTSSTSTPVLTLPEHLIIKDYQKEPLEEENASVLQVKHQNTQEKITFDRFSSNQSYSDEWDDSLCEQVKKHILSKITPLVFDPGWLFLTVFRKTIDFIACFKKHLPSSDSITRELLDNLQKYFIYLYFSPGFKSENQEVDSLLNKLYDVFLDNSMQEFQNKKKNERIK